MKMQSKVVEVSIGMAGPKKHEYSCTDKVHPIVNLFQLVSTKKCS